MLHVFQRGEITIPNERSLLTDPHSVEKQVTATSIVRCAT